MAGTYPEELEPVLEEEVPNMVISTIPLTWPPWFAIMVEEALKPFTTSVPVSRQKMYRAGIDTPQKYGNRPNVVSVAASAIILRGRVGELEKTLEPRSAWMAHQEQYEFNEELGAVRKLRMTQAAGRAPDRPWLVVEQHAMPTSERAHPPAKH